MRLIDADEVIKHLEKCIADPMFDNDYRKICFAICNYIDGVSTIEAEPVKRGRWEYDKTRDQHFCSMCGNFTYYSYLEDEIMTKYCPECSAEMDSDMDIKPAAKRSDTPAEQLGLAPAT